MKRKITLLQLLLAVILSVLCAFALFGCGEKEEPPVPEVKDVQIAAVDGSSYGKAGALHKVAYTVPEGSEVATSVKIGDAFATMADYSYSDDGYIFYTAGEYTITVYATKDGMLGFGEAKLTVRDSAASVGDVKIVAAAGEVLGKAGALHVLSYNAGANCDVQVEILKGDEPATDVVFNKDYNTLLFGSEGLYTVKVTATIGTAIGSGEAQIEIGAPSAPSVTLSLDKRTVKEDEEVTLNHTATYAGGDAREAETVSALYRTSSRGTFAEAGADTYTVNGDRFTPHVAGEWRIVYTAQGKSGAAGEAEATIKCNPAEVSLSPKTAVRQRIQTNTATDVDYLVEGAADKYTVTYNVDGVSGVEATKGDGYSVRVVAANVDYFTLTVVYTHKVDRTVRQTVDIDLYSVGSLVYAPEWGADPFDGMPSDVLTSMGHQLYFDAKACGGTPRELGYADVKYEVTESRITTTRDGGAPVELLRAGDDGNYPYVIVSDFDTNVATGSFTLKMTVTDPYTGYSAIATKQFNVLDTTNNNASAVRFIQNYVKAHSDFYTMGSMNFENATSDSRQNMVLTKTGAIIQRSNPNWPLHNADYSSENSDFAMMDFATAAANCRLEFKFKLVAPNPSTGAVWLGIGVSTGAQSSSSAGYLDLHLVDGRLDITNGLSTATAQYSAVSADKPLAVAGTTMYLRIDRRVNNNVAEYTVYAKAEESATYRQFYRCTFNVSTTAGRAGAPVKQYRFTHRNGGGCYSVEDVTVTNYDA